MLSIDELNEIHLDVLREIGNIGAGNAATSLSQMLNAEVNMSVPKVRILDISDAATALGGPENPVVGILTKISGEIDGLMMFIVGQSFAGAVLESLLGEKQVSYAALTEMQLSAISEIGNIMISAYLGSISTLSQMSIKSSVPAIAVDMVGALLSAPAIEMRTVSDKIIFIQEDFLSSADDITSNMMLIPSMESLDRLMQKLGIQL